jgi:hypothetical protein
MPHAQTPPARFRFALGTLVRLRWDPDRSYRVLQHRCTWRLEQPPVMEYAVRPEAEQDAGLAYWCSTSDLTPWRQRTMQEATP